MSRNPKLPAMTTSLIDNDNKITDLHNVDRECRPFLTEQKEPEGVLKPRQPKQIKNLGLSSSIQQEKKID